MCYSVFKCLLKSVHVFFKVERLLRGELEEMSKVKEKFVCQSETLSKENKDLLNKLEQTREELDQAKTKVVELEKQKVMWLI